MRWIYSNGKLMHCAEHDELTPEMFEHLTGKKIEWNKRESEYINTARVKGHIKIYDETFIQGEQHKYKSNLYTCTHVGKDGTALLNKIGKNMVIKSAKHPEQEGWEIA